MRKWLFKLLGIGISAKTIADFRTIMLTPPAAA